MCPFLKVPLLFLTLGLLIVAIAVAVLSRRQVSNATWCWGNWDRLNFLSQTHSNSIASEMAEESEESESSESSEKSELKGVMTGLAGIDILLACHYQVVQRCGS